MTETQGSTFIRQFWIMNREGLCLFHRSNLIQKPLGASEEKDNLMSGMFTALFQFSNQLTNSDIKKFELNETKMLFFADINLLYVVEAPIGIPDKKIKNKMDLIKDSFVKKFRKQLTNFTGEISAFHTFETELDKIFKKMSLSEEWGNELANLQL